MSVEVYANLLKQVKKKNQSLYQDFFLLQFLSKADRDTLFFSDV